MVNKHNSITAYVNFCKLPYSNNNKQQQNVWSGDLNVSIFKQMTLASDPQAEFFSLRFLNLLVLKVPLTQKLFCQQSKSYCPTNKKNRKN